MPLASGILMVSTIVLNPLFNYIQKKILRKWLHGTWRQNLPPGIPCPCLIIETTVITVTMTDTMTVITAAGIALSTVMAPIDTAHTLAAGARPGTAVGTVAGTAAGMTLGMTLTGGLLTIGAGLAIMGMAMAIFISATPSLTIALPVRTTAVPAAWRHVLPEIIKDLQARVPCIITGPDVPPATQIAAQTLMTQEVLDIPEVAVAAAATQEAATREVVIPEAAVTAAAAAAGADN